MSRTSTAKFISFEISYNPNILKSVAPRICAPPSPHPKNRDLSSIPGHFQLLLIVTLSLLLLTIFTVPTSADPLDDDPDDDGYDGQFSRPGDEIYSTREEHANKTDPFDPDSDGDLMPDGWEVRWDFNPNDGSDWKFDPDGDGVNNLDEYLADTNPRDVDLDRDGIPDIWEDLNGLNSSDPNDADLDPDLDGLTNYQEFQNRTLPFDPDTDDDGMWDGWEVANNLDPNFAGDAAPDSDHGGVSNLGEFINSTDPWDPIDDYGNAGGGNGGSGIPTGNGVPPDTGRTDTQVTLINVFEPPLGTQKRWQILDGLSSEYLMYLRDNSTTLLNPVSDDYEFIFYGALNVSLTEGIYFRIPNPSPDSQLITFHFEPAAVTFFKDPADSYYVLAASDGDPDVLTVYHGTLYFTFGTNGEYFTLDIPTSVTTSDVPESLLPVIHSNVRTSVDWFLANADDEGVRALDGETNLALIVNNLTNYFSHFTQGDGDVPDPTGNQDIYQAIAINKIGACRHRSFAFFVTANALGVPTRYVANEAHAFVEVYIPDGPDDPYSDSNWHRIDLGGAGSIDPGEPRPPNPNGTIDVIIEFDPIPSDLFMGESFTMFGNITDLDGIPLPPHPFAVYYGDEEKTIGSTDANGSIVLDFTLLYAKLGFGNLSLRAHPYNGYLGNSSINRTFELYTQVILNPLIPIANGRGLDIFAAGFLTVMNETVLPDETISLSWDGVERTNTTTTDRGNYNLSYFISASESPGEHTLNLTFIGHNYILSAYYEIPVDVTVEKVLLTADLQPASQDASDIIWVNGSITDSIGANLTGRGSLVIMLHGNELVNSSVEALTDDEGRDFNLSLIIPATLGRGDYILNIRFLPNEAETIPGASMNLDLYVDKITTHIYLFPGIIEIGEQFTINGTLYSGSGIHVPGEIALYWDGDFLTTVLVDEDGDFSYQDTTREGPGPVEIRALYNGSDMFTPSMDVTNYSIFSFTHYLFSTIDPAQGWITRNQTITVQGELLDDNNRNVVNMTVYLYAINSLGDEQLIMEVQTDDTGFELSYFVSPDLIPGPLTLEVLFRETGYYRRSSMELDYTVHAITTLDIVNVTNPVQAGSTIWINGTLMDDMDYFIQFPLSITFLEEIFIPSMIQGNFSWNYTIPITQESGDFELLVYFEGMNFYESSFDIADITIYHLTNITPFTGNVTRGDLEYFQGVIRDELGNGIPSLQIDLYLRDEFIGTTISDDSGSYGTAINLRDDLDLGEAQMRIQFNGTAHYFPFNVTYDVNIFSETFFNLSIPTYTTRDNLILQGWLMDNLDLPLANRTITIEFNNGSILLTTNETGYFIHQYIDPIDLNFHIIEASFDGYGFYLPSNELTSIRVVSYITFLDVQHNDPVAGWGFVISGKITDDLGNNITTELNVTLASPDHTIWKHHMALNGVFNTSWTLYESLIPGPYTLYINNSNPYPSTSFLFSTFIDDSIFLKRATIINLHVPDGVRGEEITITGNVTDVAYNPVQYSLVQFTFEEFNFIRQTDAIGEFSLTFTIPDDIKPSAHTIVAYYEGNLTLVPMTAQETVWVFVPTTIVMQGLRVHWSVINITGSVQDNLGNKVEGSVDLTFDGRMIGTAYSGPSGFKITYPHKSVGVYEVIAEYDSHGFYLGSEASTNFTLYSFILINYDIFSPITNSTPEEFGLENPVLAGSYFNFTLNITTDLGILPPDLRINRVFAGVGNVTNQSNSKTSFFVGAILRPQVKHNLTLIDNRDDDYFQFYPDPTYIRINVVHQSRISVIDSQNNGILSLDGKVRDNYQNPRYVDLGTINVSRNEEFLDVGLLDGKFEYSADVSDRWGPENYTFVYPANQYYLGSNLTISVYIKAFSMITLSVPDSLKANESYTGTVHLQYLNGDPIPEATVYLLLGTEWLMDSRTVNTGQDGKMKFQAIMDNDTVTITAEFIGNDHFYPSLVNKTIKHVPEENGGFDIGVMFTSSMIALYLIIGIGGVYVWRRKQIKYLMSLVHDTALRLEGGESPKSVIIIAYNLMQRHLRRFHIIRREHETVSEFKGTTQRRMRLSEDGIGTLTNMMEYADYSSSESKEVHKESAVKSLRDVERELAGLGVQRGGRR